MSVGATMICIEAIEGFDLPRPGGATLQPKAAGGFSHYRRFYMGLVGEDGTPKLALEHFARHTPDMAIMQWFHFDDPQLDDTTVRPRRLDVTHLRPGRRGADSGRSVREGRSALPIESLKPFEMTVTDPGGIAPHPTSLPGNPMYFADFCARMIERYAPARPAEKAVA